MSDTSRIQPRTLKGFRDFLPEAAIPREALIATAIDVYRAYGYSPIDTPALEYSEILLGKGSDEHDKQTYRFDDPGGRDIALRFDLTVPLARFVAQYIGQIGTPFKRYHVAPVWRGENPQRGRYREFVQCDFDTIGTESGMADAETILVVHDLFVALGFDRFTVKVNDRRVLNGLLELIGLEDHSADVLRSIDKLPKIGISGVAQEITRIPGATAGQADAVVALVGLQGTNQEVLAALPGMVEGSATGEAGVAALAELAEALDALGLGNGRVHIDVSIARGLDYYTGIVFETFLDDLPSIGSCCSGGRYDDLASLYTKQRLPGVGGSLGVDRLLAAMEELGHFESRATWAPVLVTIFDQESRFDSLALAARLRAAGVGAEVYPEAKKLGTQLKYADRRGHRVALIAGPNERAAGAVQVKDLSSGEAKVVPHDDVLVEVRRLLEPAGGPEPISE